MRNIRTQLVLRFTQFCVRGGLAAGVLLGCVGLAAPAVADIIPGDASTEVTESNGSHQPLQHVDISGGQRSADGGNQFHTFSQFDLEAGQVANFLTTVEVQNILGQIGGDASSIDGLLQVVGSEANLYLINPSGILFGPNAQLNLLGNFTATTASHLYFGDQTLTVEAILSANEPTDYASLLGTPTAFGFSTSGALANLGNLAVDAGKSVSLHGGTVLNTGTVSAPGGHLTLIAVEDGKLLRVGQSDQLLSLEISPDSAIALQEASTPQLVLGELLTGSQIDYADTLLVESDGTVRLVGSSNSVPTVIPQENGDTVVSGTVSTHSPDQQGGTVDLLGTRVGLFGAEVSASGATGGGTLRIGGDYQGGDARPSAVNTFVDADSSLRADALSSGDGGDVYVWSDETTQFYGNISGRGGALGGDGGFAEISGKQNLVYRGSVSLEAPKGTTGDILFDPYSIIIENGSSGGALSPSPFSYTQDNVENVTFYEEDLEQLTNVTLQAYGDIRVRDLDDNKLGFLAPSELTLTPNSDRLNGGSFVMEGADDTIVTRGGDVKIIADRSVTTTGSSGIVVSGINTTGVGMGDSDGRILLRATDRIEVRSLDAGTGDIALYSDRVNIDENGTFEANVITIAPIATGRNVYLGSSPFDTSIDNLNIFDSELAALGNVGQLNVGTPKGTTTVGSAVFSTTSLPDIRLIGTEEATLAFEESIDSLDWTIKGRNRGTVSWTFYGPTLEFFGIGNLVGARDVNTVVFENDGAKITQSISGGRDLLSIEGTDNISVGRVESDGGNISISSTNGSITTGPIISANATRGGMIDLSSPGDISAEYIDAGRSLLSGDGRIVINSQSNVGITGSFADIVPGDRTSIGTSENERITIVHGGLGEFIIGDASNGQLIGSNGAASQIAGGGDTIENTVGETTGIVLSPTQSIQILSSRVEPEIEIEETEEETVEEIEEIVEEIINQLPEISTSSINVSQELTQSIKAAARDNEIGSDLSLSGLSVVLAESDEMDAAQVFNQVETTAGAQFESFLSFSDTGKRRRVATLAQAQDTLNEVTRQNPQVQSALVYVYFVPSATSITSVGDTQDLEPQPDDQLEVMLISAEGVPVRHRQWGITRAEVEATAAEFRKQATSQFSRPQQYLPPAQQLYRWLLAPIEDELVKQDINNLAMIMDEGLRTLPLSALHDGEQFLIERYSVGLMPTFSLTDSSAAEQLAQTDGKQTSAVVESDARIGPQVLAMGASKFSDQPELPAVEAELSFISDKVLLGNTFLNEAFTLKNIEEQVASLRYNVVHLATHATFESDDVDSSYIQLWEQKMRLSQLQSLGLGRSNIDLVILSACSTAMGDRSSEYGFAGLAISAGSKSAMASLWPVSDEGTLGFMTQFYEGLSEATTRSETLRQAQLSLLSGDIGISEGQIYDANNEVLATLPSLKESGTWDFSHPFYWSAFTMIGSPW